MSNVFKALTKETKTRNLPEPTVEVRMVGYEATVRVGNKKWTSKAQRSTGKAIAEAAKKAQKDLELTSTEAKNINNNMIDASVATTQ